MENKFYYNLNKKVKRYWRSDLSEVVDNYTIKDIVDNGSKQGNEKSFTLSSLSKLL